MVHYHASNLQIYEVISYLPCVLFNEHSDFYCFQKQLEGADLERAVDTTFMDQMNNTKPKNKSECGK